MCDIVEMYKSLIIIKLNADFWKEMENGSYEYIAIFGWNKKSDLRLSNALENTKLTHPTVTRLFCCPYQFSL